MLYNNHLNHNMYKTELLIFFKSLKFFSISITFDFSLSFNSCDFPFSKSSFYPHFTLKIYKKLDHFSLSPLLPPCQSHHELSEIAIASWPFYFCPCPRADTIRLNNYSECSLFTNSLVLRWDYIIHSGQRPVTESNVSIPDYSMEA